MYLEGLMYYSKYCKEVNRSKYWKMNIEFSNIGDIARKFLHSISSKSFWQS
jgi:hypothetical protein